MLSLGRVACETLVLIPGGALESLGKLLKSPGAQAILLINGIRTSGGSTQAAEGFKALQVMSICSQSLRISVLREFHKKRICQNNSREKQFDTF